MNFAAKWNAKEGNWILINRIIIRYHKSELFQSKNLFKTGEYVMIDIKQLNI